MSTNRVSLAQQIALLEEATPTDIDPEDTFLKDHDEESREGLYAAAREHYLDVGPSALRKMHDSILDPKYEGKRTTRVQLMAEQEDDHEYEDDGDETEGEGSQSSEEGRSGSENVLESDQHPTSSNTEGHEKEEVEEELMPTKELPSEKLLSAAGEGTDDLSSALQRKRDEDREKGRAISHQIGLWDSLLDARIRLHKSAVGTNRIPNVLDLKEYEATPSCEEAISRMLKEATTLSEDIFVLQEQLLASNGPRQPLRKRRRIDEMESRKVLETWVQEASEDVSALEASYHPHLIQILAKWSAKVQAVSPSVLLPSNRGTFASKGAQKPKSVLQLIDEVLVDHDKLITRTQVNRSKETRIGQPEQREEQEETTDTDIFDDTDFYQQMLRDIIDSKWNSTYADDWITVQKQKKAKKKVDTKASKGRKLRYEPHEKIENFMMPVPTAGGWHEEQIDELFASLLGKGFETAPVRGEDVGTGESGGLLYDQVHESLKEGFRVFG